MTVKELKDLISDEQDDLEIIVQINEQMNGPEYAKLDGYTDEKQGKLLLIGTMLMDDDAIYRFGDDLEYEQILADYGYKYYGEDAGDEAYSLPDNEDLIVLLPDGGWKVVSGPDMIGRSQCRNAGTDEASLAVYLKGEA